ncbi:hypothetical protein B0H13DRAFT_1926528 [Mycena leptocephala]|nr:hypothetical protein B0H13DRAFT_1926528 [Mycena leptocephala]
MLFLQKLVFIVHNALQTSCEAAVASAAFDIVENTNKWTVSPILLTFPTPVADIEPSHVFATVDVVWMGKVERLEQSGRHLGALDNSAALHQEVSRVASCALETAAATFEHQESAHGAHHAAADSAAVCQEGPDLFLIAGTSAAAYKRHELSADVNASDGSAAMRHKKSHIAHCVVDTSAATHTREHQELPRLVHCTAGDSAALRQEAHVSAATAKRQEMSCLSVPFDILATNNSPVPEWRGSSRALGCEFGDGTYLRNCQSNLLVAGTGPILATEDKVAETVDCTTLNLAAGVDTGPCKMEGLCAVDNSVAKANQNWFEMDDWNDLLEAEDQLGPLPVSWNRSSSRTSRSDFVLPTIEYGKSLGREVFEFLRGRELEDMLEIVAKMDEQISINVRAGPEGPMWHSTYNME